MPMINNLRNTSQDNPKNFKVKAGFKHATFPKDDMPFSSSVPVELPGRPFSLFLNTFII